MEQDVGASLRETGSRASTEPPSAGSLGPAGFDPARVADRISTAARLTAEYYRQYPGEVEIEDIIGLYEAVRDLADLVAILCGAEGNRPEPVHRGIESL